MSYWFFVLASLVSFGSAIFHGLIEGRIYLEDITLSDMMTLSKSLRLVSWHISTKFLSVSSVTFAFLAYYPGFEIAAYPLIGMKFLAVT